MKNKTIAKSNNLKLTFAPKSELFKMSGGKFGEHKLFEPCFNARVSAHWEGYMANNGVNWNGHPEFFPNEFAMKIFDKNITRRL